MEKKQSFSIRYYHNRIFNYIVLWSVNLLTSVDSKLFSTWLEAGPYQVQSKLVYGCGALKEAFPLNINTITKRGDYVNILIYCLSGETTTISQQVSTQTRKTIYSNSDGVCFCEWYNIHVCTIVIPYHHRYLEQQRQTQFFRSVRKTSWHILLQWAIRKLRISGCRKKCKNSRDTVFSVL